VCVIHAILCTSAVGGSLLVGQPSLHLISMLPIQPLERGIFKV